jgi:hypothetical protein
MCGEVHYFRLARDDWAGRLKSLKDAGCTAVASYIPWLWHELPDGTLDVTGRTRPERDIAAFIDLCREHDLWFIARPGPFVMAELKNEGLPYRLYTEHPRAVPRRRRTPRRSTGPDPRRPSPAWSLIAMPLYWPNSSIRTLLRKGRSIFIAPICTPKKTNTAADPEPSRSGEGWPPYRRIGVGESHRSATAMAE